MDGGAWWAAVHGVARSRTQLSDFTFTFHFHALEKEMTTHSSVLAWRIPGTGEPGGLPSMGSQRVGQDWSDLAAAAASHYDTSPWKSSAQLEGSPLHFGQVDIISSGQKNYINLWELIVSVSHNIWPFQQVLGENRIISIAHRPEFQTHGIQAGVWRTGSGKRKFSHRSHYLGLLCSLLMCHSSLGSFFSPWDVLIHCLHTHFLATVWIRKNKNW